MKRTIIRIILLSVLALFLSSCEPQNAGDRAWNKYLKSSDGTTVTIAMEEPNSKYAGWLEKKFVPHMKNLYNIELKIEYISLPKVISRIKNQKVEDQRDGDYDILILPDSGFKELKEAGALYGPFADQLKYIENLDRNSLSHKYREGIANEGFGLPIGRNMLTLLCSDDIFYDRPQNYDEFFDTIETLKGKATYPDPRYSKAGEAFLLGIVSKEVDMDLYAGPQRDIDQFRNEVSDALRPLLSIKSKLMFAGVRYPKDTEKLFSDGKSLIHMSLDYIHSSEKIRNYEYPETSMTFAIDSVGTYTVYSVIPFNSRNKSGAMVTLSELISPDIQADKMAAGEMTIYHKGTDVDAVAPLKRARLHRSAVKFSKFFDCIAPDFDPELRSEVVKIWAELILGERHD